MKLLKFEAVEAAFQTSILIYYSAQKKKLSALKPAKYSFPIEVGQFFFAPYTDTQKV